MTEIVVFIVFGALAIAGGVTVVVARNPVYSALGLVGTLFSLAVFYVVQLAHFVAAVQVIVYAGAVMTLFLFVIMLIGVDKAEDTKERLPFQRQATIVIGLAALLSAGALLVGGRFSWITGPRIDAPPELTVNGTVREVGQLLFTEWVLPFEATSLLLIVASVGALALAYFRPRKRERE